MKKEEEKVEFRVDDVDKEEKRMNKKMRTSATIVLVEWCHE